MAYGKEEIKMSQKVKDKIFDIIMIIISIIAIILCLAPFLNEVSISLSSNRAVLGGKVYLLPVEFNISSYLNVIYDKSIIKSFFFTVELTLVCTFIHLFMTILAAYPLSRRNLKGIKVIFTFMLITMYFGGGMIPNYLLVKGLGIRNTMWALILPGMIGTYNVILFKSFFMNSISSSIEEAAYLDGCGHISMLLKIILPLSKPIIATISLFMIVGRWNAFQDALMYIDKPKLYPLQLKLYQIVSSNMATDVSETPGLVKVTPEGLKAATVMVITFPILLAYPWLQKYFVSVNIGSVKE